MKHRTLINSHLIEQKQEGSHKLYSATFGKGNWYYKKGLSTNLWSQMISLDPFNFNISKLYVVEESS